MLQPYFKSLYQRTMSKAYARAHGEIVSTLEQGGACLDCGAQSGQEFRFLQQTMDLQANRYTGIEWNPGMVAFAREQGLDLHQGDLNQALPFEDDSFRCIFGLSVLEHLLNPCRYLGECYRCLEPGGALVILTPNISTYFTAALVLAGKMPSTGPHPDSDILLMNEELFKVSSDYIQPDAQIDTPMHRHLVIFSFRVLRSYLGTLGFHTVKGYGFGLYPFPNFTQPLLEKIDPYHCHQMVFVATK